MSSQIAERAVDLVFQSPSRRLKIEFQGGEPLLNFDGNPVCMSRSQRRVISPNRRDLQLCDRLEPVHVVRLQTVR